MTFRLFGDPRSHNGKRYFQAVYILRDLTHLLTIIRCACATGMTFLVLAIALASSSSPCLATGESTGPAKHPASTAPAQASATSTPATSSSSTAPSAASATPQQPVDRFVTRAKAIEQLLGGLGWAIVALVVLLVFRKSLIDLLKALTRVMEDRGVSLDFGTVKLQVTERALDTSDDRSVLFSMSPFDIEGHPSPDGVSILREIAPQLEFQISDYVGERWAASHQSDADALRVAMSSLTTECIRTPNLLNVRTQLVALVRALEACRFFQAYRLAHLLDKYLFLRDGILALTPKAHPAEDDDYKILHATGVAYAQSDNWALANRLLDKIAWKQELPHFLAAGDTWLACAYRNYIRDLLQKDPERKLDSFQQDLLANCQKLLEQGQQIADALDSSAVVNSIPPSSVNKGYSKREIQKVIGLIASIAAHYSDSPETKSSYCERALKAFGRCKETIDGDPPSPLDHNNLADLYREMGKCAEAHAELDQALKDNAQPDATFCNTRAMIFWKEQKPLDALLALRQYRETHAREASAQNVDQYVENQILAAKLAISITSGSSAARLAEAADLLEVARRFCEDQWPNRNDAGIRRKLRAEIDELLGFAYVALQGSEMRAFEAFDRLRDDDTTAEIRWRRQLGLAKALTRLAQVERRKFSSDDAIKHREQAARILADSNGVFRTFGLEASVPLARQIRHLRVHCETAVALQDLAQETFHGGAGQAAQKMIDQEATILLGLEQTLDSNEKLQRSLGVELMDIRSQIRFNAARRYFLLGLILLQSDPGFTDTVLLVKVEALFVKARAVDEDFNCRIDLALGEMLLAAALAGKDNVESLYRRALASFELAATRNAPALRGDTIRALADAYARRNIVLRKAKESKRAA